MDRIKLSSKAKKYYGYQRCKSRPLTHDETETFAYDFHKGIYDQIAKYIPNGGAMMDFGCGIGIINIFCAKSFATLYLVDGTVDTASLDNTFYGFHGAGYDLHDDYDPVPDRKVNVFSNYCFYNDLTVSKDTIAPYLPNTNIICMTPDNLNMPDYSLDLVQSHMSWGWHYPFDQYRSAITNKIKPGGTLIIDIRDNTLQPGDLQDFRVIDKLANREQNSRKYILEKC